MTEPKLKVGLPDSERGLSPFHIARFDRLKRKLARTDLKPKQREEALDEMVALEAGPKLARERAEVEGGIEETLALATARAAIEAMGEPTEAMIEAGGAGVFTEDVSAIYRAMLAAALTS